MNTELYESTIDPELHGDLTLQMNTGGNLRITITDPTKHGSIGTYTCFTLPPNSQGWSEVENLICSLQEWVKHTKELGK